MRGLFTGDGVDGCEAESVEIEAGKEMFPFSQEQRRECQVHLINQAGSQILTNGVYPAPNPNVFAFGGIFRFF